MSRFVGIPFTAKPYTATLPIACAFGEGEVASEPAYSPTSLFASNEEGAFYDFSNLATLRQNSDGTTAVVDYGDPVGFVLDQSKGSSTLTDNLGAELVADPDFNNPPDWSLSGSTTISGGKLNVNQTATFSQFAGTGVSIGSGTSALITIVVDSITSGEIEIRTGFSGTQTTAIIGSPGTYTYIGNSLTSSLALRTRGAATVAVVDSLSMKIIPGNHLTQSTSTARPLLARVPVGGRRNLLSNSEDFSSDWITAGITESSGAISEDGTTGQHRIESDQTIAFDGSSQYVWSIEVKAENRDWIALQLDDDAFPAAATAYFNVQSGTTGTVAAGADSSAIEDVGDGYYRCSVTATSSIAASAPARLYVAEANNDVGFTGLSQLSVSIRNPQVEKVSTATPYQKVTAAYDITEAGKADVVGLLFDGVDDFLVSPSIDLTGTDEAAIAAGFVQSSNTAAAAQRIVAQNISGTQDLALAAQSDEDLEFRIGGSTPRSAVASGVLDSTFFPVVAIGRGKISTDQANLSGTFSTSNAADQGSGNLASAAFSVGAKSDGNQTFHGFVASALLIDRRITDEETTELETYLEEKAGVE
jgi:hypothetical protein